MFSIHPATHKRLTLKWIHAFFWHGLSSLASKSVPSIYIFKAGILHPVVTLWRASETMIH